MRRYRSRGKKNETIEGLDIVVWIVFGIPIMLISMIGVMLGIKKAEDKHNGRWFD